MQVGLGLPKLFQAIFFFTSVLSYILGDLIDISKLLSVVPWRLLACA